MSLKSIESLGNQVLNIVILVQSAALAYNVKNKIKDIYDVHRDFVVDVETAKQLNNAKLDAVVAPMLCDKWLISVNADKLNKKDLLEGIAKTSQHSVTVYWTENWGVYHLLTNSNAVKLQGVHAPTFRFTRLGFYEIIDLIQEEVPPKKMISEALLNFVAKNYKYDVQSVMDLIQLLKSGNTIESKKELIEAIGVGGNSIGSLAIQILKTRPATEKARDRAIATSIRLMRDLSYTYDYNTIRRFMIGNIDGFIDMKQLYIMGIYDKPFGEIPDGYDSKRISMLRRFDRIILSEVDMIKLLNLKMCLLHHKGYNAEVALIQAITHFYSLYTVEPDKPKASKASKKKAQKDEEKKPRTNRIKAEDRDDGNGEQFLEILKQAQKLRKEM